MLIMHYNNDSCVCFLNFVNRDMNHDSVQPLEGVDHLELVILIGKNNNNKKHQ